MHEFVQSSATLVLGVARSVPLRSATKQRSRCEGFMPISAIFNLYTTICKKNYRMQWFTSKGCANTCDACELRDVQSDRGCNEVAVQAKYRKINHTKSRDISESFVCTQDCDTCSCRGTSDQVARRRPQEFSWQARMQQQLFRKTNKRPRVVVPGILHTLQFSAAQNISEDF